MVGIPTYAPGTGGLTGNDSYLFNIANKLRPPRQNTINQNAPQTGLIGGESAIQQGLGQQLQMIGQGVGGAQGEIDAALLQGRGDINQGFQQGIGSLQGGFNQAQQTLNPFTQQGQQASAAQAALSGALGPEQQAQAYANFQDSPGQQFLREQGQRELLSGQAAIGGLGGGNVRRELLKYGTGLAAQNMQQQFNNMGTVANRGASTAGQQAGLQATGGQAVGGAQIGQGQQLANLGLQGGQTLANLGLQGGLAGAQATGTAAGNLANMRYGTGQQIAQAAGGTTSALANLQNQLGSGLASQYGAGAQNLANLVSGAGAGSSALQQNLSTILANIGTGSASQAAQYTDLAGQYDASGILGQNTAVQNALGQLLQLVPQGGGGVNINQQLANQTGTITPQR